MPNEFIDNFSDIISIIFKLVQTEGCSNFLMLIDNKTEEMEDEHKENESEIEVGE